MLIDENARLLDNVTQCVINTKCENAQEIYNEIASMYPLCSAQISLIK